MDMLDMIDFHAGNLMIIDRKARKRSTFPSEIVTCELSDGRLLRFFCKYEAGRSHKGHGHRAGVAYEADVYRQILQPLPVSTPRYFGAFNDESIGGHCMVLEYLQGYKTLGRAELSGDYINRAASWIGHFHYVTTKNALYSSNPFLITYSSEYYLGWIRRTLEYSKNYYRTYPWIPEFCNNSIDLFSNLSTSSRTIIHGEYYPGNIAVGSGVISPLDWESAAVAMGEIDLAMLTDCWPPAIVDECETEYRRARRLEDRDPEFRSRLAAARLYIQFRWLGDRPKRTARQVWRFEKVRALGEQLGLIRNRSD
jgi:hypothetical protein